MDALFDSPDLLSYLVQFCSLEDVAYLRYCNRRSKSLLESSVMVSLLSPKKKKFVDYVNLIEYHISSFEDDLDNCLLAAVQEDDVERLEDIFSRYSYARNRPYNYTFYQMFFVAGCNNNTQILELLSANISNGINSKVQFMAGQAYSGGVCDLTGLSDKELSLILLEAIRGGNKDVIQYIKSVFVDKAFLDHVLMVGAAASDDLETIQSYSDCLDDLMEHRIPIIDGLGSFADSTNNTHLVIFALHYNSSNVLEYLTEDSELDECFRDDGEWYDKEPRIYLWINERVPFTDDDNRTLLWNAACADNLPLVKVLKRYLPFDAPPHFFDEMIECDTHKVVAWLLRKYSYKTTSFTEESLEYLGDNDNRASCLVNAYIKKRS